MTKHSRDFDEIMQEAGLHQLVRQSFSNYYQQVIGGATGQLSRHDIQAPAISQLADYEGATSIDNHHMDSLLVIKLNGGLGTSMGLKKAKSLLPVKGGINFLDIIVCQILTIREKTSADLPLIFMDSFNTQADTLAYLNKYPQLKLAGLELDFLQNKFPKIVQADMRPLANCDDKKNWNPPGHGDIYHALAISGLLDKLITKGYKYAFISNADNLGATVDTGILNYLHTHNVPFLMEVCARTPMDKKGGHLAQDKRGQLILRERAQCPYDEIAEFEDIEAYKYFNTNNLWINLEMLARAITSGLQLPLILNPKEVGGVAVWQIESAMGAAINNFSGAMAMQVPRKRFVPVKKTNELLALWSDAYSLDDNWHLLLNTPSGQAPQISLDPAYYQTISQLEAHVTHVPSLVNCTSLSISGEVFFDKAVVLTGQEKLSPDKPVKISTLK